MRLAVLLLITVAAVACGEDSERAAVGAQAAYRVVEGERGLAVELPAD